MTASPPRLLFLDFDGVLHPTSASGAELFCCGALLLQTLEDAGGRDCGIVVSSSWRHHHPWAALLRRLPPALAGRVVGTTGEPHVGRWPRYHEILRYVQQHAPQADWRALDDAVIEFPPGCASLIACRPNEGFGTAQREALGRWLATA